MRIELNSGGLGSGASIENMQSNVTAMIGKSNAMLSAFNNIKTYMFNMNGGIGNLQDALSDVQSRIQTEETRIDNLNSANDKIDSFIELTHQIDNSVTNTVTRNQSEFYEMNPWSRPASGAEGGDDDKAWYEKVWDWICDAADTIVDTAKKIWDGITSYFKWRIEQFINLIKGIKEWWKNLNKQNTVFDVNRSGYYGGNQMVFEDIKPNSVKWVELYEIFRSNNPDIELSEPEFDNYLNKLTSEGCGYVALCNTIFEQYMGREDEFEATFGYPMYDSNGNLNFAALEMDMYSRMDNIDPATGEYNELNDYDLIDDGNRDSYNYLKDSTGVGTYSYEQEYYLEQFMSEHGVNVDAVTDVNVTIDNYDNIVGSGKEVIVAFYDGYLYNMDGTVKQVIDGGHAMTVTGVTDDGKFIVSSWGKQYYIDPSEDGNTITVGSGTNQHDITQSMTFLTIEYQ